MAHHRVIITSCRHFFFYFFPGPCDCHSDDLLDYLHFFVRYYKTLDDEQCLDGGIIL